MYDVIIIGGSYAGLAAALQLGRARKHVLILDAGQRRNRFAHASHGFLGQDGQEPGAIAAKGRAEVLAYPTVTWRDAAATEVSPEAGIFVVHAGGDAYRARRVILATGVVDELPPIPGLAERWGQRAFFCPYCDGYELGQGRLGVLGSGPASLHYAILISDWAAPGGTTFFLDGSFEPEAAELADLTARGIAVERERVAALVGPGTATQVQLRDGRTFPVAALFLMPRARLPGGFAERLGLALDEGKLGPIYRTDANKETSVPGLYACGDVAVPAPSVSFAVADGVRAGAAVHQSLVFRR